MPEYHGASEEPLRPRMFDHAALTLDALKLRLAVQLAPRRWRRGLNALAAEVDHGIPLDVAFVGRNDLPRELRHMVSETLRFGDPVQVLIDILKWRHETRRGWRQLLAIMVYPSVLFVFALLLGSGFTWVLSQSLELEWMDDFGLAGYETVLATIEDQHHAVWGLTLVVVWCALVAATIWFLGPPWAWVAVAGGIVVIGRPLRWLALQELIARFYVVMQHGKHGQAAAVAVADSFRSGGQSVVARCIEARMDRGTPVGRALASSLLSDSLCRPMLLMLDSGKGDPGCFRDMALLFGRMTDQRCRVLSSILPLFVLMMVGTVIWATMSAYLLSFMPIVSMITSLA